MILFLEILEKKYLKKSPWYLPSNSNLKSIEEIPFYNLDGSYGTSYYPEGRLILITFDCKNAIFEYCLEVEDLPPQEDIEFL